MRLLQLEQTERVNSAEDRKCVHQLSSPKLFNHSDSLLTHSGPGGTQYLGRYLICENLGA